MNDNRFFILHSRQLRSLHLMAMLHLCPVAHLRFRNLVSITYFSQSHIRQAVPDCHPGHRFAPDLVIALLPCQFDRFICRHLCLLVEGSLIPFSTIAKSQPKLSATHLFRGFSNFSCGERGRVRRKQGGGGPQTTPPLINGRYKSRQGATRMQMFPLWQA
jgi:hypothetical protein